MNLFGDLVHAAEDVGVVLLEAADAGEAGEGAAELVAVEDAEVGVADGEDVVGAGLVGVHEAVPGAVHRLQRKLLLHIPSCSLCSFLPPPS